MFSSLVRKIAVHAISAGSANRFMGTFALSSSISMEDKEERVKSVITNPGEMQLTKILLDASSTAMDLVMPVMPDFEVEYRERIGLLITLQMEPRFKIQPFLFKLITLEAALLRRYGARQFTA